MRFASKTFRRRLSRRRGIRHTKRCPPRCRCRTRRQRLLLRRKQRGGAVLPYTDPFHQMKGVVQTDAATDGLD